MLTEQEVHQVARLARLYLSDQDIDVMTDQLGAILEYIDQLNQVDTQGIPPAAHALPLQNVLRADNIMPCLQPEEALANAPQREGDYFRVPKIM